MNTLQRIVVLLLLGLFSAAGASPRLRDFHLPDGTRVSDGLRLPEGYFKVLFDVPAGHHWGGKMLLDGKVLKDVSDHVTGEFSYPNLTAGHLVLRMRVMGQPDQVLDLQVVRAPVVSITPDRVEVVEGDWVTLRARTDRGGPVDEIVWKLGDADTGARGDTLTFRAVAQQSGQRIVAVARGPGGVDRASVPVAVRPPPQPPRVVVAPASVVVIANTPVSLHAASAGGGPISEIRWLMQGADTGARGAVFSFTAVDAHNGQSVVAVAYGPGGVGQSAPVPLTVNPVPMEPPLIVLSPNPVVTQPGATVVLAADTAAGGPVTEIRWFWGLIDSGVRGPRFEFLATPEHNGKSVTALAIGQGGESRDTAPISVIAVACPVSVAVSPSLLYPYYGATMVGGEAEVFEIGVYDSEGNPGPETLAAVEIFDVPSTSLLKPLPPINEDDFDPILPLASEYLNLGDWCGDNVPAGVVQVTRLSGPFPPEETLETSEIGLRSGTHVLFVRGRLASGQTVFAAELVQVEVMAGALTLRSGDQGIPVFPEVRLVTPTAEARFASATPITLQAGFDPLPPSLPSPYAIARVEFRANGQLLGVATGAPWSWVWPDAAPGTQSLVARAYDQEGAWRDSAPVRIEVSRPNQAPVVTLTGLPATSGGVVRAGEKHRLVALATDSDGKISQVQIAIDGKVVARSTSPSCSFLWTLEEGRHVVQASATDDRGAPTSTAEALVQVLTAAAPVVDLSRDATPDWLLRNVIDGRVVLGLVRQTNAVAVELPGLRDTDWSVVGQGAFSSATNRGILWANGRTRQLMVWDVRGTNRAATYSIGVVPVGWRAEAVGDLLRDGSVGILLRKKEAPSKGQIQIWAMNGLVVNRIHPLAQVMADLEWAPMGATELDGDRKTAELVWAHAGDGKVAVWTLNGAKLVGSREVTGLPASARPPWSLAGLGDYDADGLSELVWTETRAAGLAEIVRVMKVRNGAWLSERSYSLPVRGAGWKVVGPR